MVERITQVLAVLIVMFLVGCGSTTVDPTTGKPVPDERIYKLSFLDEKINQRPARLTFVREHNYFNSSCSFDVFVNSIKAFTINNKEVATIELSPGEAFVKVEGKKGEGLKKWCHLYQRSPFEKARKNYKTHEMILREGDEREYRMGLDDTSGKIYFDRYN